MTSVDESINLRLKRLRKKRAKLKKANTAVRPKRKISKVGRAARTIDNILIFDHLRSGRLNLALLSVATRILLDSFTRPSAKFPKKKSLLDKNRRKNRSKHKR